MKESAARSHPPARRRAKPIHTARCGAVRIPVARNGANRYAVIWHEYAGAPRKRENFTDKTLAIARADELAQVIANGQADALTLTGADRDVYRLCVQKLQPLGITLHTAIEDFVAASALLAPVGHNVRTGAQTLAAQHAAQQAKRACPPMAQVCAAFMAELQSDPHRTISPAYLRALAPRLDALAAGLPELGAITPETAKAWLRALRVGPKDDRTRLPGAKTRDHYLSTAKAVMKYAQGREWLPKGVHAFSGIDDVWTAGVVHSFSVAEMRELLAHCPEPWLTLVVIGAFAGVRIDEIGRMTWDMIRWDESEIVLPQAIVKGGKRGRRGRNIPMEPNLVAWLRPRAKKVGKLYDYVSEGAFHKAITRGLHRALETAVEGFRWKDNGLRHSYGSYLYGRERNIELVRAYMGNTEEMAMRYYNDPKTKAEAAAYFALTPDASAAAGGKIVSMGGAA